MQLRWPLVSGIPAPTLTIQQPGIDLPLRRKQAQAAGGSYSSPFSLQFSGMLLGWNRQKVGYGLSRPALPSTSDRF